MDFTFHSRKPDDDPVAFVKGPKRKRLAKACDACHKSKRRCDGTSPCGNCYYASKACTYTDSAGRPVPAPRDLNELRPSPSRETRPLMPSHVMSHPNNSRLNALPGTGANSSSSGSSSLAPIPFLGPGPLSNVLLQRDDEPPLNGSAKSSLKRSRPSQEDLNEDKEDAKFRVSTHFRDQQALPMPSHRTSVPSSSERQPVMAERAPELDNSLTRELVNLFFTHCHPYRVFIHKPTFSQRLSSHEIPKYLLYAICAMAASLSSQPRLRTTPPRLAGRAFALEAVDMVFDSSGRLTCRLSVDLAQTLCLLRALEFRATHQSSRYHDLALHIIQTLGVHAPDPPATFNDNIVAVERECMRRIFWHIHTSDIRNAIYFRLPFVAKEGDLQLRMPCDETSFEFLSGGGTTMPEYLHLAPSSIRNVSEYGFYIRIITLYGDIEHILYPFSGRIAEVNPAVALSKAEDGINVWNKALPESLQWTDENFDVQVSMLATNANTGAWCFFIMHIYYASCALAINYGRQYNHHSRSSSRQIEPQWALVRLEKIVKLLATRARSDSSACLVSVGSIVYPLSKYCHQDTPLLRKWSTAIEDYWGVDMFEAINKSMPTTLHMPPQYSTIEYGYRHPPPPPPPLSSTPHHLHPIPSSSGPSSDPLTPTSLRTPLLHAVDPSFSARKSWSSEPNPRRLTSDAVVDPALHNLSASSTAPREGGEPSSSSTRNSGRKSVGESVSPQSLPSLKSSGLLDSWPPVGYNTSSHSGEGTNGSRPSSQSQRALPAIGAASRSGESSPKSFNSSVTGMPVGMPWLAHER